MFLLAAVKPGDDKLIFLEKIEPLSIFWLFDGVRTRCIGLDSLPLYIFDFCF